MSMINDKLRHRPLPVLYRWVRRRRFFPHAVVLCCAILVLPVGIIGGARLSHVVSANQALAATRALAPEHSALGDISEKERAIYAAALKGLVTENPQKLHQLIGHDFLVLFREPDLKRSEGGTVAWQYQAAGCVLDLYFDGGQEAAGPVIHYEVRERKVAAFATEGTRESEVDAVACLKEIYSQRAA